jgi:hypothetical protein
MQRDGMPKDWQSFQMANRDLFDRTPSVLDRYYTPATLNSELARRIFVMPDAIAGRQLT